MVDWVTVKGTPATPRRSNLEEGFVHETEVEDVSDSEEGSKYTPNRGRRKFISGLILLGIVITAVVLAVALGGGSEENSVGAAQQGPDGDLVTVAPTTSAPVTASPVTASPVTASPVTASPVAPVPTPTTLSPVTVAPVTGAPVTPAPITATPITPAPITPAPITSAPITAAPTTASPVTAAPIDPNVRRIQDVVLGVALNGGAGLGDPDTYQYKAYAWIQQNTPDAISMSDEEIVQRYAVACLFFATDSVWTPFLGDAPVAGWTNATGWLSTSSVCEWNGIVCSESNLVDTMDLEDNHVTGAVPAEISLLSNSLVYLDISLNPVESLHDGLAWMGELTALTHLCVGGCNFVYDGIPTYLGALSQLEFLDISYTLMFGPIRGPEVFSNLQSLRYLEMGGNSYNQTIPEEIASLPLLANLYVDNAYLSGDLSFITSMPSIFEIWLDKNPGITGTIPSELATVGSLQSISGAECSLTGTLPSELALMRTMQYMWWFGNELTGTIPDAYGDLMHLKTFHTEGNQMSGTMPTQICLKMAVFAESSLGTDCDEVTCNCCTCCSYPCDDGSSSGSGGDGTNPDSTVERVVNAIALEGGAEFEDSTTYQSLALAMLKADSNADTYAVSKIIQRYALGCLFFGTSSIRTPYTDVEFGINSPIPGWNEDGGWTTETDECSWFGVSCSDDGEVTSISLGYNGLTGGVPNEIELLGGTLAHLDLSGNIVANSFDDLAWMGKLSELVYLDVHFCNFDYDGIPPYISGLTKLEVLDISYTLFFGSLDGSVFSALSSLYHIEMGGNSYFSPIPPELANLPSLAFLYAGNTHLTGDLSFIGDMPAIFEMWLDQNPGLDGPIPSSIGGATSLQSLSLSDCGLTGPIPSELGLLTDMQQMWLYNNSLTGEIPVELSDMVALRILHVEENSLSGSMPNAICSQRDTEGGALATLSADCAGSAPEVSCACCTCCEAPCFDSDEPTGGLSDLLGDLGGEYDQTYHRQAIQWLASNAEIDSFSSAKAVQRFVLASVFYATSSVRSPYTDARYGIGNTTFPGWVHSDGWLTDDDECAWIGVICNGDGEVVSLVLRFNHLTGSFPPVITLLKSSLSHLDISGNLVHNQGSGLDWLGELTALTTLDVHFCNFHYDGVPPALGNLVNLESLDISYALFFGTLQGSIFTGLTELTSLEIGGNSYNSPLPTEIASLPKLQRLYAEDTQLTGDISFIDDMDAMFEMWLDLNHGLTGSIPPSIGTLTTLESLSISDCNLAGSIPTEVGLLVGMQQMWLYNNSLTGEIPAEIGALTRMHTFQTEGNSLSGEMPSSVCGLTAGPLSFLSADCRGPNAEVDCDCCTCCEAPCYGDFRVQATSTLSDRGIDTTGRYQSQALRWLESNSGLQSYSDEQIVQRYSLGCLYFSTYSVVTPYTIAEYGEGNRIPGWTSDDGWATDTDECTWFGIECDDDGLVVKVVLRDNGMTGLIPPEIALLKATLAELDLSGNIITQHPSDDLAWFGELTLLSHLDLHFNNLYHAGVPASFASLTNLEVLDISYTLFFGPLDGAVFAPMTKLTTLEIGGNSYYSPIPAEIASLPLLERLYAENTHLTGDLSFVGNMPQIFELWIDGNPLGASIPASIGDATTLASLSLSDCGLVGTIPPEIGLLTDMQQMFLYNNSLTGAIPVEVSDMTSLRIFHAEANMLSGAMPAPVCSLRTSGLEFLGTDCKGPDPEVSCACCTCCEAPCFGEDFKVVASDSLEDAGVDTTARYQAQASFWLESNSALQSYTTEKILQRYALACIYLATNAVSTLYTDDYFGAGLPVPEWDSSSGWLTDDDECTWFGVDCTGGAVVGLTLPNNNMTGSFPDEITLLKGSLTKLDIGGNVMANLGADQLSWMGELTELSHLDVHFNNFHYNGIPPGLAALTALELLDISYTLFFGALDGSIFAGMSSLSSLEMGGNQYDSAMPVEIAALPSLESLYAEDCALTGDLSFVSSMPSVFELWLDLNPLLAGSIPPSIGDATTLASLSVTECGLTGSIPSEMGLLVGMQQLWLYGNALTDAIPAELGNIPGLAIFQSEFNMLSGSMPDSLCELRDDPLMKLTTDCGGATPEVVCDCCSCCADPTSGVCE